MVGRLCETHPGGLSLALVVFRSFRIRSGRSTGWRVSLRDSTVACRGRDSSPCAHDSARCGRTSLLTCGAAAGDDDGLAGRCATGTVVVRTVACRELLHLSAIGFDVEI